nr:MAG TPA: hypothetical protein [Caudoviricetes sp.]
MAYVPIYSCTGAEYYTRYFALLTFFKMNIPWNAHTYDCNRPWTIAACAKSRWCKGNCFLCNITVVMY